MQRSKSVILSLLIIAVTILAACSAASPTQMASMPQEAPAPPRPEGGASGEYVSDSSNSAQAQARLVITNANISLVVTDPGDAMAQIQALATELGGFTVSSYLSEVELSSGEVAPQANITIRVEAARLDEALTRIRALSERTPLSERSESQDVTLEYTDLQSRLRNLEATEAQLTEIMDAASRPEDVLSIFNQLTSVREQIEVLKGQIQFYEQSAALSAIDVTLQANAAVQPLTIGSWEPVGEARQAVQALINAVRFLGNAAIWVLLFLLPTLLLFSVLFILPVRLVWRAIRRRQARAVPPAVPPAPPAEQA